ncbi:MAG: restriction endonuclease subunit S [Clostridia bacterium]|nr:restriction endonuclease subunit S [Clostridia bacterium]
MVNSTKMHTFDSESNIEESSLKWCSVPLSDVISRGKRLEASSYDVQGKVAMQTIKAGKYGYTSLLSPDSLVKAAYHAPRFKRNYVEKNSPESVGFLGSAEMLDIKPSADKFITKALADKLDLFVKEETVLMSCSGTIGRVSFANSSLIPFALSQHIIKIFCHKYSGYIYTCLLNDLVQKQIQSLVYGAVIQEIEPEHLGKVIIPNAPIDIKERIHNLIIKSYELRDESNELIDQATDLLIDELKLPAINEFKQTKIKSFSSVNAFNVKLSDLNYRADASYHLPIVDAIIEHLKEHAAEITTIGDSRISSDVVLPGRFKRVYVESDYGVKFLGGKEMKQLDPSSEKYLSKKAHAKQLEGSLGIKENSILTPARGSLGEVVMPCKHFYNWAISDNMMQILSNDAVCGYVYIFLNSEYGKALIKRFTYGGVVDAIEPWHIQQVQIPLLKDKNMQAKINNLAKRANEKRYEAYLLEQEALKIMDEEVIYAK